MMEDDFNINDLVVSRTHNKTNGEPIMWVTECYGNDVLCKYWSAAKGKYIEQMFANYEVTNIGGNE